MTTTNAGKPYERPVHLHFENSAQVNHVFENLRRFIAGRPLRNRVSRKYEY